MLCHDKQVLAAGEANAPETTHAVFIIKGKIRLPNYRTYQMHHSMTTVTFHSVAPSVFPMGFNLIKHLLDETTRKKIHVLGSK